MQIQLLLIIADSLLLVLLQKLSNIIENPNIQVEIKQIAKVVHSNLLMYFGYISIHELCKESNDSVDDPRTLQELLEELNSLIGLQSVKSKVQDLLAYQKGSAIT